MKKIFKIFGLICLCVMSSTFLFGCVETVTDTAHQHVFMELYCSSTCEKAGFTYYVCPCGETRKEHTAPLEHDIQEVSNVEPTCYSSGTVVYACTKCDYEDVEVLKQLDHDLEQTNTEPTCTSSGSIVYACKDCEYQQVEVIEQIEHELVETKVEATCLTYGTITNECKHCDYKTVDILDILGHDLNETTVNPTCQNLGSITTTCSRCSYETYEELETIDCNWVFAVAYEADCEYPATDIYVCTMCEEVAYEESGEALGHLFDENFEAGLTYLQPCLRETCTHLQFQQEAIDNMQQFVESIAFEGVSDDFVENVTRITYRLEFILEDTGAYNEETHAYVENSDLADVNANFEGYLEELYDCYMDLVAWYQYAQVQTYIDIDDESLVEIYIYVSEYMNSIFSQYAGYFQKAYDSGLRNYFYYGWTEEEIQAELAAANGYADPEYVVLSTRQSELEARINVLSSTGEIVATNEILQIYAEYVANNNEIAKLLGGKNEDGSYVYKDGMWYAYEQNFDREYTPDDAQVIYDNIVEYIVPLYLQTLEKLNGIVADVNSGAWTEEMWNEYDRTFGTYLDSIYANEKLNNFLKEISVPFNGDTDTYQDKWNEMMEDGNFIIGEYAGAFTTYLYGLEKPLVFIGDYDGYTTNETFVHEFGHYMNSYYRNQIGMPATPKDLSETHSQGLEMLYLTYNNIICPEGCEPVYEYLYTYQIYTYLETILSQISVDRFERAVYSNYYDGFYADYIMADGQITPDEYDNLYYFITYELGIEHYGQYGYWRYNADRFGYNISYSVSLLGSLQFLSEPEYFDEKVEAYGKLITYLEEENGYAYTYKEVLEYAGLYSYDDEQLFAYLYELLAPAAEEPETPEEVPAE